MPSPQSPSDIPLPPSRPSSPYDTPYYTPSSTPPRPPLPPPPPPPPPAPLSLLPPLPPSLRPSPLLPYANQIQCNPNCPYPSHDNSAFYANEEYERLRYAIYVTWFLVLGPVIAWFVVVGYYAIVVLKRLFVGTMERGEL